MRNAPSNNDNIIDSRDVIERLGELQTEEGDFDDALDEAQLAADDAQEAIDEAIGDGSVEVPEELGEALREALLTLEAAKSDIEKWERDNQDEYEALKSLEDQAGGYGDWEYGEILIRDDYFEEYAQGLAEDIGAIGRGMNWPLNCIDWERAAAELQMDYMSYDFDGTTYWGRA